MPKRILVQVAHPAFQRSTVNRHLVRAVEDIDGVTFNDLYEVYPDFLIDVEREQQLLVDHDVILFQHPLFWYSTPAILKEWQDLVLTHGWAFGNGGNALAGKFAFQAITTGGSEDAYTPEGSNRFTIRQLLAPLEQTCTLCEMTYLAPFIVHGTHEINSEADMLSHCDDYRRLIEALRDDRLNLSRAASAPKLDVDFIRP
ncbi:MAG: glutathione-regulated potassium-efflux system ancillary protein KefG [Verrucomicrobiales bacterium]|jgi:glutathione-regulated potassium-efflux system ancillary protein KefG